ncbi:MAG: carbohydrate kinase family protein [Phycisphaerae bacterium]|nr:carbohydrate kinase family protein [Phycisphaerae bacterium]
MPPDRPDVVVAGHICLDVIPTFAPGADGATADLSPGTLTRVGPAASSTGGTVSNTGLALHRLGIPVRLIGKIGHDLFGAEILRLLRDRDQALARDMVQCPGEVTSYSIVISPPGVDRTFLHCPGANDTFDSSDIPATALDQARLFHFGYPPLMRRMYQDGGAELARLLGTAREAGLAVSLDTAAIDPDSEAGAADWPAILSRALPQVDLFLPSFEELLFMLDRSRHANRIAKHGQADFGAAGDDRLLSDLGHRLLSMGAAVAGIKLGRHGLYLRTTDDTIRLANMGRGTPSQDILESWHNRELIAPCFQVQTVGTTGAGDCTIAGFLAALLRGHTAEQACQTAVAVGACSVEAADATSGVPDWGQLQARLRASWPCHRLHDSLAWSSVPGTSLCRGPHDKN